jgi:hypothetical protein
MIQSTPAERYPKVSYMRPEGTMEYYTDQTRPDQDPDPKKIIPNPQNCFTNSVLVGGMLQPTWIHLFSDDPQHRKISVISELKNADSPVLLPLLLVSVWRRVGEVLYDLAGPLHQLSFRCLAQELHR